ncbi:MAG: alpha/beta hydrolase [Rubrivivax sp.]|nr:alpha/beta hydrolase [Rubrivivax sp.]
MLEEPRLRSVSCLHPGGLHRMAYWEWGDPAAAQTIVCVHGLTRQGRDFDHLARDLSQRARVICPDVVGRGRSDWLRDPNAYAVPTYVADMVTLLARLDVEQVDWVGTSMGGLIGIGVAALEGSPVRRLVLNDVGPRIQPEALVRIGGYVGQGGRWPTEEAAAQAMWALSTGFGPHSPQQWLELSRPLLKPDGEGGFMLRYDPALSVPLKAITPQLAAAGEAMLWHVYDSLRCPTLLLRGAQSDLLSAETAQAMTQRGPRARLHSFEGVGHAPTLVQPDQRAVVSEFLLSP